MRFLITGGAGFVGSAVVRHLLATSDHQVTVLDALTYAGSLDRLRDLDDGGRLAFVHGDVTDPEQARSAVRGCDVVIHLAAESHVDRSLLDAEPFERTNVDGTRIMCRAAVQAGVQRFVHVSTDEVYGPIAAGTFSEDAPLAPTSPYARSKARSDEVALGAARSDGLPVIVTRSTNQFGPWQFPEKLIPHFISCLLDGKTAPLYGDGLQSRDWLHVDDHAALLSTLVERGAVGEVYNLAAHNERTNLEVAHRIADRVGADRAQVTRVEDRIDHDRRYAVSTAKVEQIAALPPRPFEQALDETIGWYVDHQAWWRPLVPLVRNR